MNSPFWFVPSVRFPFVPFVATCVSFRCSVFFFFWVGSIYVVDGVIGRFSFAFLPACSRIAGLTISGRM